MNLDLIASILITLGAVGYIVGMYLYATRNKDEQG